MEHGKTDRLKESVANGAAPDRAAPAFNDSPQTLLSAQLLPRGIGPEAGTDALVEAAHWQAQPGHDDPQLSDWRALPFVTIDNPGSRDLDQALLIEALDSGYRVRYALADAAYYIRPGSALFNEALSRGATYYAPGTSIPMLPRVLSEGLISLNPGVDRRALVFDMHVSANGHVTRTAVVRALVRSQAQLTYGAVQAFFDAPPDQRSGPDTRLASHPETQAHYAPSLLLLRQLGEVLIQSSLEREVIPFNRREAQIRFQNEPPRWTAAVRERLQSERYNEQISLLCNRQGALLLDALDNGNGYNIGDGDVMVDVVQGIYRVHDAPPDSRLNALHKRLRQLVERRQLGDLWRWRGRHQSLAHYIASLPDDGANARLRQAIEQQVMMINVASQFRAEPGRHHALAAERYARFSSPMREIVGIFTHKELLEALDAERQKPGDTPVKSPGNEAVAQPASTPSPPAPGQRHDDVALREQVIEAANQAKRVQKRVDKSIQLAVLAQLFEQDLSARHPPLHNGTLVGLRDDRLYVSMDRLALDVKVYRIDLQTRYNTAYTLDDIEARPENPKAPAFVLGDAVLVQVAAYDTGRQRYAMNIQPQPT